MFNEAVVLIEVLLMVYLEHQVEQEQSVQEDAFEKELFGARRGCSGGVPSRCSGGCGRGPPVSFSGRTDSGLG